jgi:phosphatidate phosphatase APP1
MTVVLQDPVLSRDPSSRHAFPIIEGEADLRAPRTLAEEILADSRAGRTEEETSFALESRGGYARTVTGTVEQLDEEAQTFMVRAHDGRLMRVPIRDVTSFHQRASNEHDELRSGVDVEGLGTGRIRYGR